MSRVAEMNTVVRVRARLLDALLAEARRELRLECCGLLAGRDGIISDLLPARNALSSATAYEIEPAQLFSLFRRMREERLDHLGIYHSHPQGENAPSASDLQHAYYPQAAYFIVSPRPDAPRPVRAFRISQGRAAEMEIETA
jgi:proteasome lid subunit RPN8/RPN11